MNGNGNGHAAGLNDHLPPQDLEAEKRVLSALMIDDTEFEAVRAILSPEDFWRESHQAVFQAMIDARRAGNPPDAVFVAEELMRQKRYQSLGSERFLLDIASAAPHAANVRFHAARVHELAVARRRGQAFTQGIKDTYSGLYTNEQILSRFREACEEPPLVTPDRWSRLSNEDMGMRLASSIKPKRIEWLMPDRIPKFAYTLIAGEGKQGKSQLTMALGALFSNGGEWWDGSGQAPQGHVLYLSAEDDAERAIRPRLEALGANLDQITILEARYKILSKEDKEPLIEFAELGSLEYWR